MNDPNRITVELPLEDWLKVTGSLMILHKVDKEDAKLDLLANRISYQMIESMKKEATQ